VLHEFYVNATRKLTPPMPAGDARAEVRRYQRWQPWAVDHATVEAAWAVESRHGLHYWDALMVAAAQQQGCDLLLTEDLPAGQQFDGVTIVNPFLVGPERLQAPTP
jgi:predicted nucleic acid-binding protein